MPFLSANGDVNELYLGTQGVELDESNPENRFRLEWIDSVMALLADAAEAGKPLVITATGKYFTNGLDTDYVFNSPDEIPSYLDRVQVLYTTVLTLPVPTVAAVNGHAFGAGAMLALCADHRVMRTERGFWSLPEAALRMPFSRGMAHLVRTRVPDAAATEAMVTSRRYGAHDAVAAGIVDEAVDEAQLLPRAFEIASARAGTASPTLGVIKRGLRASLLEDLAVPTPATVL